MSAIDDGCEDSELRDLVAHTLENNGVLNKIRAQLRASVFLALEEQPSNNRTPLINKEFKDFIKTEDGRAVVCLIREFLEFFNLEFTQSVFTPETEESIHYNYTGRDRLLDDLGLDKSLSTPILLEILRRSRTNEFFYGQISQKNISLSKDLFNSCDKDKNGKIDKETAIDLLMDIYPNFRRSLVDRFILDEYQSMGKNLNAELNYDEFFGLYKKLYSICQSVTLHDTALFVPAIPSNKLQKSKMSTVETINISPIPSSIGIEKNDLKANLEGEGCILANLMQNSIKDDNVEGDDSFFDDPPMQSSTKSAGIIKGESNRCSAGSENPNFYRDSLPPLVTTRNQDSSRDSPLLATLERDINSKLADLNEDYDEDFQSSEQKTGSDGSIGEEIEEDTSAFGDLLGSTASGISLQGNDNITTDKTVSQMSQSGADYLESFIHDSADNL